MRRLNEHIGAVALAAMVALFLLGWVFDLNLAFVLLAAVAIVVAVAMRDNRSYVMSKLTNLIPILLVVTFLTFYLVSLLPGDPAVNILGPGATPEAAQELRDKLRLDDPVLSRYGRWIANAVTGDLGESPFRNEEVGTALAKSLPVSLQLMLYAQVVAVGLGVLFGVLTAYKEGSRFDRAVNAAASLFLSSPSYVLGPLLVLFLAVGGLRWFGTQLGFEILPAARYTYFGDSPWGHFKSVLLPTLTLALPTAASYTRLLRTDMVATLKEDFINVARAKGLSDLRILFGHALRPSSFTLLTVLGINVGFLIGNALIVETIFTLPGVGSLLAFAVFQRDYLVIQGGVVVLAVGYVLANFMVDLLYSVLDPRVRHARAVI